MPNLDKFVVTCYAAVTGISTLIGYMWLLPSLEGHLLPKLCRQPGRFFFSFSALRVVCYVWVFRCGRGEVFGGRFEAKLLFAEVIQPEVKTRRVIIDLAGSEAPTRERLR